MKFGICGPVAMAAGIKSAGWDYVEENVQNILQAATVPDDSQWTGASLAKQSPLPVPAANVLVPGGIKITGPTASLDVLTPYMEKTLARAEKVGIKTLVFGSGGARNVPDGFDRKQAEKQITDFVKMTADIAKKHGITIVAEPLNKGECNIINTVAEAMTYVKAINHPNFQCLVDSYHFWLEDEPLENLKAAMPWIKHVHLADKEGRVAPGLSGKSDYRPFFKVLKDAKYDGLISFEGNAIPEFEQTAPKVLEFIKKQWNEA